MRVKKLRSEPSFIRCPTVAEKDASRSTCAAGSRWVAAFSVVSNTNGPGTPCASAAKVAIRREVQPIIGFNASILFGLGLIIAAAFVSRKFDVPSISISSLLLPTTIVLLVGGMFLLIARRNAIAMVLGYIMMENGIYLVGTTFSVRALHIVEFGILLDVLAAVMIMAIILQNIKKTFDNMDTALLRTLKE
jgi:hydrogenase-4 component E